MKHARQKTKNTESESRNPLLIRTVAGQEVGVVRSTSAAIACIQSCPPTVVLDCEQVSLPNQKLIQWILNMIHDSHRVVVTGSEDIPVAPIHIDGVVQKPLTDEKLQILLSEFDYRDRYATILSKYTQCVFASETATGDQRQQALQERLSELRTKLDEMDDTSDVSTFGRTMREILQSERYL